MVGNSEFKVLLVDDEPDILELMEEEFKFAGYNTMTALCGNEAIEIISKGPIHAIISDYKMPNGNGMSVLSEVNKLGDSEKPLFYFVSGQADISVEDAIHAGAKRFYSKPFDLDELIEEIGTDIKERV